MQPTKTYICVLVSFLFFISCNETATTSKKNDKDTTKANATDNTTLIPAYDRTLDPFVVSGVNAKLLQDSLGMKIFEWWVKPGELVPLHRHPDHAMYVLQGGKAIFYSKDFPDGEKGITVEFKTGEGWIGGPVTDSARNIGNTVIKMLEIDTYRPRNK